MIIFGVPLQNTEDRMQIGSVVPEILKTGLKHHISDLTKISIFSTIIDFFRKTKNTPRAMIITYHMPKTASKSVHWILSYDRGHKQTNRQRNKRTTKDFFHPSQNYSLAPFHSASLKLLYSGEKLVKKPVLFLWRWTENKFLVWFRACYHIAVLPISDRLLKRRIFSWTFYLSLV